MLDFGAVAGSRLIGLENADRVASVVGGCLAVFALLDVARWSRPPVVATTSTALLADDLAVTLEAQWRAEAGVRALDSPHILPLVWRSAGADLQDTPAAVLGVTPDRAGAPASARVPAQATRADVPVVIDGGVRLVHRSLDGRLEGRFENVLIDLAAGYRDIPSGRLVVIGEPGAGKTVVAVLLMIGLLSTRSANDPVPVLLNASTWDPVTESLDSWVIESIARSHYEGRTEIPAALWQDRRLLPVLDGLDEIPEAARRGAVRSVNAVLGTHRPVIVTCRAAEYADVIAAGAPVLHRAPVLEIQPVSVRDLTVYLDAVTWPDGVDWNPALDALTPGSPLAQALATPLMVTFTRLVYERLGRSGRADRAADPARGRGPRTGHVRRGGVHTPPQ
jgi:hypothetical protein